MIIACLLLFFCSKNCENRLLNTVFMIVCMTCPWAPTVGGTTIQSGQQNNGIRAPNTQQLHHRLGHINRTLHSDIEKPTTLEKTFNKLHKINIYVFMKKIKFCWNNLHLIVGTTQYYDTQQTIHNTTNNTQHKIHSCYVISFGTFFCRFGEVVCLSWIGLGTGGSWTVCWQRQKMVVRVTCTEPSLHSPHS